MTIPAIGMHRTNQQVSAIGLPVVVTATHTSWMLRQLWLVVQWGVEGDRRDSVLHHDRQGEPEGCPGLGRWFYPDGAAMCHDNLPTEIES